MNKNFSCFGWEEYLAWQQNKKILKKIHELIKDIERNGQDEGIGKPEALKHELTGYWSRKITEKDRLIYKVDGDTIHIIGCKNHYNE